ncbi:MAG TPA: kelch repeat-containing protein [Candidatus Sulfotelmatobacter sp.]|nr:kelch repeat-containing protein [Candidatus Sulfotelmatobacter sp.]
MSVSIPTHRFTLLPLLFMALLTPALWGQKWNRYGPGTRSQSSAIYDASTNQMIMFGGQHAPTNIDFNDTWTVKNVIPPSSSKLENLEWVKVSVMGKGPSNRFGHTAVYNSSSNRMVVFGGGTGFPGPCVNELWVLKNPNAVGSPAWSELTPTGTLPPAREGHTAVYDSKNNIMIVFGGTDCLGNYYNDLWIVTNADGSTGTPAWSQLSPNGSAPSARTQSTAVYDSANNIMTVFGGATANKTAFNDVWTLSNANGMGGTPTWTKLSPMGTAPVARSAQSAFYDSVNNRMVIHGGMTGGGGVKNDTWVLTKANGIGTPAWSQLKPTVTGPYRASHTAIWDSVSNDMVIFGGDSQLAKTFTDDHVMILTNANGMAAGATWTQAGPVPRYHSSAVYDSSSDQMIVFGGEQSGTAGALNDVWAEEQAVVDGQAAQVTMNWVQVFPTGTAPSARFGHSAFYDSGSNRMIVFGGATTPTSCLNEVWALNDANSSLGAPAWFEMSPSGSAPLARMNQSAVYDSATNVLIVYGGTNCAGGYFSDIWTLNNANGEGGTPTWTQLSASGAPPAARENASVVYDSANNILTVYAGDAGGNGFSDVWTLSNANGQGGAPQWTQLKPSGTAPKARTGQSAVYDSANNRMIIFGGINSLTGTGFLGDTWILTNANGLGGTPAWVAEKVTGTAPLRRFHNAFYSTTYNDMLVFGGESQITQTPADDHVFILSVANGLK